MTSPNVDETPPDAQPYSVYDPSATGDNAQRMVFACFSCDLCKFPLCKASDIIVERADIAQAMVFAYELDVFNRNTWCYSATNPGNNRFDVVRIRPVHGIGTRTSIPATDEHTWFPGYGWRMAVCRACGYSLGWSFSPIPNNNSSNNIDGAALPAPPVAVDDDDDLPPLLPLGGGGGGGGDGTDAGDEEEDDEAPVSLAPDVVFHGLILTNLTNTYPTPQQYQQAVDHIDRFVEQQRYFERVHAEVYELLATLPNRYEAHRYGMMLMALRNEPRLRGAIDEIAIGIRLASQQVDGDDVAMYEQEEEDEEEVIVVEEEDVDDYADLPELLVNSDAENNEEGDDDDDDDDLPDLLSTSDAAERKDDDDDDDDLPALLPTGDNDECDNDDDDDDDDDDSPPPLEDDSFSDT